MQNRLTILGSGTCVSSFYKPFDFRYPSGHLLQYNGKNILLDCSEGIRSRLAQLKFDYFDLDAICISHLHPDHFNVDSLLQSLAERAAKSKTKKTLTIIGPENMKEYIIKIWDFKHVAGHYEKKIPDLLDMRYYKWLDGQSIAINGDITVQSFKVFHGVMDAYTLRFMLGKTTMTYSGDTGECDGIVRAAQDADLFLCEAAFPVGNPENLQGHLEPYTAGKIARDAQVKHLILVHYPGKDLPETMVAEVKRANFSGEVTIGQDFQMFSL